MSDPTLTPEVFGSDDLGAAKAAMANRPAKVESDDHHDTWTAEDEAGRMPDGSGIALMLLITLVILAGLLIGWAINNALSSAAHAAVWQSAHVCGVC